MRETTCFLYGSDMSPEAIRADPGLAGARFIDIGSVEADAAPHLAGLQGRVHGIVLTVPRSIDGYRVEIARRRGEPVNGIVWTGSEATGDRDAVIAEARYWELPVAWRRFLSES